MNKSIADSVLYNFFGTPGGGVVGTSFQGSYVSSLASQIAAGSGFFYDGTQVFPNASFRLITSTAAIPVTHTSNVSGNPRYDLVCLAPNWAAVTAQDANRYIKTGGTGPITLTTVHKEYAEGYALQVVAGTPGASPVVPSTPA